MAKIIFTTEQIGFLHTTSDILLRNTGATHLMSLAALFKKLDSQDADFDAEDIKLTQLLCDVALKASGLVYLTHVVSILNKTINFKTA